MHVLSGAHALCILYEQASLEILPSLYAQDNTFLTTDFKDHQCIARNAHLVELRQFIAPTMQMLKVPQIQVQHMAYELIKFLAKEVEPNYFKNLVVGVIAMLRNSAPMAPNLQNGESQTNAQTSVCNFQPCYSVYVTS